MDKKRIGERTAALLLCLCLCVSLCAETAAAAGEPVTSITREYAAETVLEGEAVCPLLLPGGTDSVLYVRWISRHSDPVTVHYGPDDGSGRLPAKHATAEAAPVRSRYFSNAYKTYLFYAELQVEPGTKYLYGLSLDSTVPTTLYAFTTAGEAAFSAAFTSDAHVANARHAGELDAAMEQAREKDGISLICCTGDVNENSDTEPFVLTAGAPVARSVPIAAVCGNHDLDLTFYEYFRLPNEDAKTRDYWFVKDNVLFLGLNIGCRDAAAHAAFIRAAAKQNGDCAWTVAMLHFSLWSNGSHGRDALVLYFRDNLPPAFSEAGVDIRISGHDHEYDRSPLIDGKGEPVAGSDGARAEARPGQVLYLSIPTATGTKFYTRITACPFPPAAEALKDTCGYVLADFTADAVTIRAISLADGQTVDSFTLTQASAAA